MEELSVEVKMDLEKEKEEAVKTKITSLIKDIEYKKKELEKSTNNYNSLLEMSVEDAYKKYGLSSYSNSLCINGTDFTLPLVNK